MGRLQSLPPETRQTGFTCPLVQRTLPTQPRTAEKGRGGLPRPPPTLLVASPFFYLTLPEPQTARTQRSSWSSSVSSNVCETVPPKHKHQPLTCFKKRHSWMTAEPKQTKWGGKKGKQLAQFGWRSRSCYTLCQLASWAFVAVLIKKFFPESEARTALVERFLRTFPPEGKQLPPPQLGRDSHQAALWPPWRRGCPSLMRALCAR